MSYFQRKFNQNDDGQSCNCPNCRGVPEVDVEVQELDIMIPDQDEILAAYYQMIIQADSEEEILELLASMLEEGVSCGIQHEMYNDIQVKMQMITELNKTYDQEL